MIRTVSVSIDCIVLKNSTVRKHLGGIMPKISTIRVLLVGIALKIRTEKVSEVRPKKPL